MSYDVEAGVYASPRRGAQADKQALLTETEKLLDSWKHPDPYTPPTAPGGMSDDAWDGETLTMKDRNTNATCPHPT